MRVVFTYMVDSKPAIAALPIENIRILRGSQKTWVLDSTPGGLDRYLVSSPEDIAFVKDEEVSECMNLGATRVSKVMPLAEDPMLPQEPRLEVGPEVLTIGKKGKK